MEATTAANVGAVSISSVEMSDAGSASYNNEEVTAYSSPNKQELNFESLDSLYSDAVNGDIDKFQEHSQFLDQILTPNGNTILHIHITARPRRMFNQERTPDLEERDFVRKMLGMCPALLRKANKKGETLLHMAARHGHADVANFLLDKWKENHDREHGITAREMLQMINEAKDTALHEAVRYNHLDVVRILTKEDTTLSYDANTAGETPLYLAAERGYEKVLKEILGTCISPAHHGPYSRTALHAAVICYDGRKFSASRGIITLLLDDERIQKNKQDQQGWTALHFAAHFGYLFIVKNLIMKDKSAAYKADNEGKTALHVAASLGRVNIMEELIFECPGCCELVDNRGWNVLHFAATSKNKKAVVLVLENPSLGKLINEKDEKGNTPFLQAASEGLFILHSKVDKLVFNNDNHNASHMLNQLAAFPRKIVLDIPFWRTISDKRCQRVMSRKDVKDEEEKEENNDPVNSKSNDEMKENSLVASTLVATVTFAAGFTVPGGVVSDKGPDEGAPILTRRDAFRLFFVLNSISFFLSSYDVIYQVYVKQLHRRKLSVRLVRRLTLIGYAIWFMTFAFSIGTYAMLRSTDRGLAAAAAAFVIVWSCFVVVRIRQQPLLNILENCYSYLTNKLAKQNRNRKLL